MALVDAELIKGHGRTTDDNRLSRVAAEFILGEEIRLLDL